TSDGPRGLSVPTGTMGPMAATETTAQRAADDTASGAAIDSAGGSTAEDSGSRSAAARRRADVLLAELAGPGSVLREDQWTAIEALVVDRRRALVVQRTGWGKSAVYFIAAKLLREA